MATEGAVPGDRGDSPDEREADSRAATVSEVGSRLAGDLSGVLPTFAGVSCFLALIQVSVIGLGLARVRLSQPLAIAVLVISIALAWVFAALHRQPAAPPVPRPEPAKRETLQLDRFLRVLAAAALIWVGWTWLQLWVLALLRSPYGYDGLAYHVPAIHDWVLQGRVGFVASIPDIPYTNYPMGVELSSYFAHYLFQTSRLLDACNLWYWPLAFTGLAVIAGHLGARGIWRWLAGALIFGASAFVSVSVSAYIDPGFASTVIGAVAASCILVFHGRQKIWWAATLLGLNVGLMLGSKGFGLPFAITIGFFTALAVFWASGLQGLSLQGRALALAAVIAFAVGGYWYARNLLVTGNPIYPIQLSLGEKVLAPGIDHGYWAALTMPEWVAQYPSWARVFVAWLQLDAPIHFVYVYGGLGYIWILGCVPAVVYVGVTAVRRRQRELIVRLAYLAVLVLPLLYFVALPSMSLRTLWLHALGLPCLAVALHDAVSRWQRRRLHLLTIAFAVAVVGVAVWESNRTVGLEWEMGRDPAAEGVTAFGSSLTIGYPGLSEAPGFREFLQADTVSRWRWRTSSGQLFGGVLAQPLGRRKIIVVPTPWTDWRDPYAESMVRDDPGAEDILLLQRSRVEWIVWDSRDGQQSPQSLSPYVRESFRFQTFGGDYLHLARLAWPETGGAAPQR